MTQMKGAVAAQLRLPESPPPAALRRGARRMFGLKDLFTALNALGGVAALCFCIEGDPARAAVAIMLGYAADMVDGKVARARDEANRFGAEFDTAADFVTQAIAPAFVVYLVYRDAARGLGVGVAVARMLALALAAVLILAACARAARRIVRRVDIDFAWIGLPQTAASFVLLGFINSDLVARWPGTLWAGLALVPALAWLELSNLPFKHHRGVRTDALHVRLAIVAFAVTTAAALVLDRRAGWDLLCFWNVGYVCASWTALTKDERRLARLRVREANLRLQAEESTQRRGGRI